jgi:hypothetical protein
VVPRRVPGWEARPAGGGTLGHLLGTCASGTLAQVPRCPDEGGCIVENSMSFSTLLTTYTIGAIDHFQIQLGCSVDRDKGPGA